MDGSGTITEKDFKNTQKFVNTIQAKMGLADNHNKAAVVTYGDYAKMDIKCSSYSDIYKFKSAVSQLSKHGEKTNTRDGLEKGQELLTNQELGCGEEGVKRIIVLLTDGIANKGIGKEKGLIKASKDIQKSGTIILVVAVGQFSDEQLVKMVPSDKIHRTKPDKENGFTALIEDEFVLKVKKAICESENQGLYINRMFFFTFNISVTDVLIKTRIA